MLFFFFFQAEDGIRDAQESRGLGDVYKRQINAEYGEGCAPVNNFICPSDRPSPIFATFCTIINAVMGLVAIIVLAKDGSSTCTDNLTRPWTGVMIGVAFANFIFGIYLYFRFTAKVKEGKGVMDSACRLIFCDFGNFCYMGVALFQIVWIIIGGASLGDEDACDSMRNGYPALITIDIVYLTLGCVVMFFSLMTECCRAPRWTRNGNGNQPQQQQQQTQNAQYQQPVSYTHLTLPTKRIV
eukprot:TRINITY_DN8927_c0_g1_i4.p1 TRINITY_DN8927_c0_g1~~TRINITY_DN8927_c0_g1_i4.p1  ORF type:complete len:241 (+),score=44.28 TRINITY_DN8927_c0_g1_i4:112-834(+)